MVTARDGDAVTKVPLADRFQEAIDEAAMQAGIADSDAYLAGWRRDDWTTRGGDASAVAAVIAATLDQNYPQERLDALISEFRETNA